MLIREHWCVYVQESIWERHLWVRSYFSSNAPHAFLVVHEWFVRWEVGGRTTGALWGVASRICSEQHVAFLCSYHLAFFSKLFAGVHVVHPNNSIATVTAWKKSRFILSEKSDFTMYLLSVNSSPCLSNANADTAFRNKVYASYRTLLLKITIQNRIFRLSSISSMLPGYSMRLALC